MSSSSTPYAVPARWLTPAVRALLAAATVLVAVVSGAAGPTVAVGAPPTLVSSHYFLESNEPLALAGADTLVASSEAKGNDIVLAIPPTGRASVIARVAPNGDPPSQIDLAASSTRLAVLEHGSTSGYKDCCATYTQRLLAGPLFGALQEQTAGCLLAPGLDESVTGEVGVQRHYVMALDGDVLAYDSYGCVVVEDLASGLQRIIRLEATLNPVHTTVVYHEPTVLAVAGRLIAYRANRFGGEGPAALVVYNIDSGQELYRVPIRAPEISNGTSFALQSDGTLVVSESLGCRASISTVAEPTPRALGIPACAVDGLADGRLLVEAPAGKNHKTLGWTTLQAPALHPIADLGLDGVLEAAAPVLSGTEAGYALKGCWAPSIYRAPLNEPGMPPSPPTGCAVRVGSHATVTRRALTITIRCPHGCQGLLETHVGSLRQLRARDGGEDLDGVSPSFSVAPGRVATIKLLPTEEEPEEDSKRLRRFVAELRRGRRIHMRLDFYPRTPSGIGDGSYRGAEVHGVTYATHSHAVIPLQLPRR